MPWIKPRVPSAKQNDQLKAHFSTCFLKKMHAELSHFEATDTQTNDSRACYTCCCSTLSSNIF